MFVGAYWSARAESREEASGRIARFLDAIAGRDERLATWFRKGTTPDQATGPLAMDRDAIAAALTLDDSALGVGYGLGAWNGGDVSLGVTIGASNPRITNHVVLSFRSAPPFVPSVWMALVTAAIDAFDPDHAVVTSHALLDRTRSKQTWAVGLLTYARGEAIVTHDVEL